MVAVKIEPVIGQATEGFHDPHWMTQMTNQNSILYGPYMDQGETQAESETMLAIEFGQCLTNVVSCCHDESAIGTRVLSHDVFHIARVHFAVVIAKKCWPRVFAMAPVVQK